MAHPPESEDSPGSSPRATRRAWLASLCCTLALSVQAAEVPTDRVIVRLKPGAAAPVAKSRIDREALATRLSAQSGELLLAHRTMGDGALVMRMFRRLTAAEVRARFHAAARAADILEVLPDRLFFPALTPNDTSYGSQWYLTAANGINAPAAWDITTGSANLVIGVIDTGKLPHNELVSRWIGGYDFVSLAARENDGTPGRDADATDPGDWVTNAENASGPLAGCGEVDSRWHGTLMAGVIGAASSNGAGIAGVNWGSKILPVRVVGKCGGYESDIADGMRWAAGLAVPATPANTNAADVLNVSLSTSGACSAVLQSAVNEVSAIGVPVIVAAGNHTQDASGFSPANCAGTIAVAAVDRNGGKAGYTNFGNAVAVSAPGGKAPQHFAGGDTTANQWVLSTSNAGLTAPTADYGYLEYDFGTSIATAQVTGIASLMLSARPTLTPAQLKDILQNTARAFPTGTVASGSQADCTTALCGKGIVNAQAAVQAAGAYGIAVPQVAAGSETSMALAADGRVYTWGYGAVATLGDGGAASRAAPALVPGLEGITSISLAGYAAFALRADGVLFAWGGGSLGVLGDGTGVNRPTPTQILGDVVQVDTSGSHTVVLRRDGTVWTWGYNHAGQLGDGTTNARPSPGQVAGAPALSRVHACSGHTAGIRGDGTVWSTLAPGAFATAVASLTDVVAIACRGEFLALHADRTVSSVGFSVTPIPSLLSIVQVASGGFNVAVRADGTVFAWGTNDVGQLGTGVEWDSPQPVIVARVTDVLHASAGSDHGLAVKRDGQVFSWGRQRYGALGDGVDSFDGFQKSPLRVLGAGGSGVLGLGTAVSSAFVRQTDVPLSSPRTSNTIVAVGIAASSAISITGGEFSIGCTGAFATAPTTIDPGQSVCVRHTSASTYWTPSSATLLIAGIGHVFEVATREQDLRPDWVAFAPSANVAPGSTVVSAPLTITGIDPGVAVTVSGGEYSVGCTGTFTGNAGTIGPGQTVCVRHVASTLADTLMSSTLTVGQRSFAFDSMSVGAVFQAGSRKVSAAGASSFGLHGNGDLYAWGYEPDLGINGASYASAPRKSPYLSGVRSITAGNGRGFAVRSDGTLWAWGAGFLGGLGDGTRHVQRQYPVRLALTGVRQVASGHSHAIAVTQSGEVYAWGRTYNGQLGTGLANVSAELVPVLVPDISNVVAVAAYDDVSLALKSDGTVWIWGNDGSVNSNVPVQRAGFSNVAAIAINDDHIPILGMDGVIRTLGCGYYGQFGNGYLDFCFSTPQVAIGFGNPYVEVAAGKYFTVARLSSGEVASWGRGHRGQLGRGGTFDTGFPGTLSALTGAFPAVAIAAGGEHALALLDSGEVYSWGSGNYGALGNNAYAQQNSPVRVVAPSGTGSLSLGPDLTYFTPVPNATPGAFVISNLVLVTGITDGSALTIVGGEYSLGCSGTFTAAAGTIHNNQSLCVRLQAAGTGNTLRQAILRVGGIDYSTFSVTTSAGDSTPDPYFFPARFHVAPGATVVSDMIMLTGFNVPAPLSISGGEYSLGCGGTFSSAPVNIVPPMPICVRTTAAATEGTTKEVLLNVGGMPGYFTVHTRVGAAFAVAPRITAGGGFVAALRTNGAVHTWGANDFSRRQPGLADTTFGVLYPTLNVRIGAIDRITAGGFATFAMRAGDNVVWGWGANCSSSMPFTGTSVPEPRGLFTLDNVAQLAAGSCHGAARKADGTVWSWGAGTVRGDGFVHNAQFPVQTQITNVAHISARGFYTAAAKVDGTVWTWGSGWTSFAYPQQMAGFSGIAQVAAGTNHLLGLRSDGTVWAYGSNSRGQLGDGTTTTRSAAVQVSGLANVMAIAAGDYYSLALRSDGSVWSWGDNGTGQLGDGTTADRLVPVRVLGLPPVEQIAAGVGDDTYFEPSAYAAAADGRVFAWGSAVRGALGNGVDNFAANVNPVQVMGADGNGYLSLQAFDTQPEPFAFASILDVAPNLAVTSAPVPIVGLGAGVSSPVTVAGGQYSINGGAFGSAAGSLLEGDTLAVRVTSGSGFGSTTFATVTVGGASGRASSFHVRTRLDPALAKPVARVAAGDSHTYLLATDGAVYAAGYNGNGQLGNGSTLGLSTLAPVVGLTNASAIASGAYHGLALRTDGTVAAWGSNSSGQLGHGSASTSELTLVNVAGLANVVGVTAGRYHSVAVKADGTVWAWGLNAEGQVGSGALVPSYSAPVLVAGLAGATAVAAGGRHTLALMADGTVRAWGANDAGQLGDGSTAQRISPVPVSTLSGVVAIAAGDAHSLAIRADGSVVAWGFNGFGQLGDGTTTNRSAPVAATGLTSGVGLIAAGANHSMAVKAGGAVYTWGNNANSQIGNGNNSNVPAPVLLANPAAVVAVAGGARHSAAIGANRSLYLWGDNFFGQVGNRSGNYSPHSSTLNVLRGDSVVSTGAGGSGSGVGTGSNSGSSVLSIDNQQTGFNFGSIGQGTSRSVGGKYKNAAATANVSGVAVSVSGPAFSLAGSTCPATLVPDQECTFTIGFNPSAATSYNGELLVQSSVVGAPEKRSLLGVGVAPASPALALANPGIDFAPQTLWQASGAAPLAITNTGTAALTVSSVSSTLGDFAATHNCASIAPGASCSLSVTFTPTSPNARVGSIAITSNAAGSPHAVAVSGTGVATTTPPPMYTLTVTKAGTGSGSVSGGAISCGGACSASLGAGTVVSLAAAANAGSTFTGWSGACAGAGACQVTMTQAHSVTATFTLNAATPTLTLSVGAVDFGGQSMGTTSPESLVVATNTGTGALTISSVGLTAGAFAQANDCTTLATGASCTVRVTFAPPVSAGALNASIPASATLTVTSVQAGAKSVALSGTGERSLVTQYYRAILNRAPDAAGKAYWEGEAARLAALGVNVNEVWFVMAGYFFSSAEYLAANKTDSQFVSDLYNTFFNRPADAGGLGYWTGQIAGGLPREVVLFSFMFSNEFRTFTQAIFGNTAARPEVDMVVDFFRGILNRLPDTASFNYWLGRIRTAQCAGAGPVYTEVDAISAAFIFNPEYGNRGRNTTQYVTDMYYSFLRRGGDIGGVQYWINELATNARDANNVRTNFLNSPEFGARVQAVIAAGCVP